MSRKHKRDDSDQPKNASEEPAPEVDDAPEEARSEEAGAEQSPEEIRQERDSLLLRLQRLSADYVNYQKRATRDVELAREYANEQIMRDMLAVLDDMERALEAGRETHSEDDPFVQGMQLVHDKALDILGKFGVRRIDAVGERFDPERMSAMMQEPSSEHEPMTVLREVQKGYRLKDRTLRPAAVVVAREADEEDPE
jgi:molecular chaperone GrpE